MKLVKSNFLALSFALVLIGILVIQAYWFFSVVQVKNERFDDDVFESLQQTVQTMEKFEDFQIVTHVITNDSLSTTVVSPNKSHRMIEDIRISSDLSSEKNQLIEHQVIQDVQKDSFIVEKTKGTKQIIEIKNANIQQEKALRKRMSGMHLMLKKLSVLRENQSLPAPDVKEISKILKKRLAERNIHLPFDLALKMKNKTIYEDSKIDSLALFSSVYHSELYPDDVFKRKGQIFLFFPSKSTYIFSEMLWMLIILIVFTLLLIFMFYWTLANFKKQKTLNELKSDFINNMTHELKTPLATIQIAADTILKQSISKEDELSQKMAFTIKQQGKRVDDDVKNLLQIAMLDNAEAVDLNVSEFNIIELLNECRLLFDLIAKSKEITIHPVTFEQIQIIADRELLLKAINNLIDNALKYSESGQAIVIQVRVKEKMVIITVTDQGIGIAKAEIPFVFDRFYRTGKGNIHSNKGYGLGLSFVKKIIELHQGKIELESEEGKGTSIHLLIPLNHE